MLTSIIIPLYNKCSFIERTLSSVIEQTQGKFEILVIDDGSTDDGYKLIEELALPQVRLIRQANAGVSAARNKGIAEAKGDWIAFLDGDDWQHPQFLSRILEAIQKFPADQVFACHFKPIPDSPDWSPSIWEIGQVNYEIIEDLPSRWMQGIPFFTGSIVIKRDLLQSMQPCFPVGESFGEDLDLWFRIAENNRIICLDLPLIAYRTAVSGSLTQTHGKSLLAPYLKRMAERAQNFDLADPRRASNLRFVAQQYITQARLDASRGKRREAIGYLMQVSHTGKSLKRWWATLLMTLLLPGSLIQRWQHWRETRTAH